MPCRDYGPYPGEPGYPVDDTNERKWMLKAFIGETGNKPVSLDSLDNLSAQLCNILKLKSDKTISGYTKQLQDWWIEHQKADRRAEQKRKDESDRKAALSKLTDRERKLLNL